jgi:hypothetical protein
VLAPRYDAARRSLQGYAGVARLAKDAGMWTWEGLGETVSPGFEANDFGFVPVAGINSVLANVRRSFTTPSAWYHSAQLTAGIERVWNADGDHVGGDYHAAADLTSPSYWTISTVVRHLPARVDDRLLRGGPAVAVRSGNAVRLEITTDTRRAVSSDALGWWSADRSGNQTLGFMPSFVLRPTGALVLRPGMRLEQTEIAAQFITAVNATDSVGDVRRVVGTLHQRTAAFELRAAAAVTSTLSFDLYLQPFLSAAAYRDFGEVIASRAGSRVVYGRDVGSIQRGSTPGQPDRLTIDRDGSGPENPFTVVDPTGTTRSLRGTAVIRWEYRPGADLYIAWMQTRSDPYPAATLAVGRDLGALLSAGSTNALVLKVTYRLGS